MDNVNVKDQITELATTVNVPYSGKGVLRNELLSALSVESFAQMLRCKCYRRRFYVFHVSVDAVLSGL